MLPPNIKGLNNLWVKENKGLTSKEHYFVLQLLKVRRINIFLHMIVTAWSQKKGKRLCAKGCVKHKTDWKAFKIIALIRINNLLKILPQIKLLALLYFKREHKLMSSLYTEVPPLGAVPSTETCNMNCINQW